MGFPDGVVRVGAADALAERFFSRRASRAGRCTGSTAALSAFIASLFAKLFMGTMVAPVLSLLASRLAWPADVAPSLASPCKLDQRPVDEEDEALPGSLDIFLLPGASDGNSAELPIYGMDPAPAIARHCGALFAVEAASSEFWLAAAAFLSLG